MSELKAHRIVGMDERFARVDNDYYLKSEADKVIAEKDKVIAELQKQVHDYAQGLYAIQARAEKEARHDKYKRCVAMADLCFRECQTYCALIERGEEHFSEMDFYGRWNKIWLILAEKFKERI